MSYESHKHYNGNLYASIAKDVKNQPLIMDPSTTYFGPLKTPQWKHHFGPLVANRNNIPSQSIYMRLEFWANHME